MDQLRAFDSSAAFVRGRTGIAAAAFCMIAGVLAVAAPLPLLFSVLVQRTAQPNFASSREATAWRASGR